MKNKFSSLHKITEIAKSLLKEIKIKYPHFQGYAVFSSRFGDSKLRSDLELLIEFPRIVEEQDKLDEIKSLILEKKKKDISSKRSLEIESRLNILSRDLTIQDDVFVELRFEQLNFELIAQLKKDPIISHEYTIHQARSIAVVLFRVNDVSPDRGQ